MVAIVSQTDVASVENVDLKADDVPVRYIAN